VPRRSIGEGPEAAGLVDLPVEEHVGHLQSPAGANLSRRDFASVDQSGEVGARHVEQVGRLLSGDFLVVGDTRTVKVS